MVGGNRLYGHVHETNSWLDILGLHKNSNSTVGDWGLYDIIDSETGIHAKVSIGKAEDIMANGTNRRAHTSARQAKKNPDFKNAEPTIVSTHKGITKGEMKEIEAARVRKLREEGHKPPLNREKDKRYKPNKGGH